MLVGKIVVFERSSSGNEVGPWSDNVDKLGETYVDSTSGIGQYEEIPSHRRDSASLLKSRDSVFRARTTASVLVRYIEILRWHGYARPSSQVGGPVQLDKNPIFDCWHVHIIAI